MDNRDQNGHNWVDAPPGTAVGQACNRCGIRFANPKSKTQRCPGRYRPPQVVKPALHQFDPYQ